MAENPKDKEKENADDSMSDLDTIREILLEPGFSQMFERIIKLEKEIVQNDLKALPVLKTDIHKLRQDVDQIRTDITDIKMFMQGMNKKITTAFKAFND